ncbi:DUF4271 domain-containing protein [Ulvibacterium marinum]|uniref:DUF4271 domain-containing protein n=1 Tax=Ulvibacterium marinum TaxID=2419782 RepID=UPI0024952F34|nr:DUF4271 domain-containing protein [Ulvibacterium marinum]
MEPILRNTSPVDWITLMLFGSLLLIVVAKSLFYGRFLNFVILPFNNKYTFMYNKKEKLMNWFHVFFTLFQIINFSLFIFLASKTLLLQERGSYPFMYPIILGGLVLFILLKMVLQLGNGFVFGVNKVIGELIFKKLSYLNHSSMVMFLANVVLVYVFKDSEVVVYLSICLILSINAIGWITVLKNHQKFITANFFYFILYLCALEIAPFIIIGSYLKD